MIKNFEEFTKVDKKEINENVEVIMDEPMSMDKFAKYLNSRNEEEFANGIYFQSKDKEDNYYSTLVIKFNKELNNYIMYEHDSFNTNCILVRDTEYYFTKNDLIGFVYEIVGAHWFDVILVLPNDEK